MLMEVQFPQDYPHQPFFIRVVSPRYAPLPGGDVQQSAQVQVLLLLS
jgi:ubiquitin-protein ligase